MLKGFLISWLGSVTGTVCLFSLIYKISENSTTTCPKCGAVVRPHRVCKECGTYKGREVIKKEEA